VTMRVSRLDTIAHHIIEPTPFDMLIAFKDLDEALHQRQVAPYRHRVEQMGRDLSTWSAREFSRWLGEFDARLDCEASSLEPWVITYSDKSAIPLAEWLVAELHGRALVVGRPPGTAERALGAVRRLGADFSSCRVRVGFTRGHLLDVYVLVPFDVAGSPEQLQVAAEVYLETLLGDRILDEWVDQVAVDRIARSGGLLVVSDVRAPSVSYPLTEVDSLLKRGIHALRQSLPESHLASCASGEWTALSLERAHAESPGPRLDRLFASTCHPEALKACLLGLGFCSARFTLGEEIFIYLRWAARGPERPSKRQQVEDLIELLARRTAEVALAGSGFGEEFDYLDLWVLPRPGVINTLLRQVAELVGEVELGFYDSRWSAERLVHRRSTPLSS